MASAAHKCLTHYLRFVTICLVETIDNSPVPLKQCDLKKNQHSISLGKEATFSYWHQIFMVQILVNWALS